MKMASSEDESPVAGDLRRGPWTVEEDLLLVNYIAAHGEGRWNALARCAGLKRTGKSCRLRWLNYLRPDLRRGNMTAQEQLLILELHSRWGNRWSKIAQHLPGRTDNEIKNYWRTRVQKHARQLNCDVNSQQFKDLVRYLWMPRLLERSRVAVGHTTSHEAAAEELLSSSCTTAAAAAAASSASSSMSTDDMQQQQQPLIPVDVVVSPPPPPVASSNNNNADYWSSSSCSDNNMSVVCDDTWCQPPRTTTTSTEYYYDPSAAQYGAAETTTCCWSEVPALVGLSTAATDMGLLPDLGDTMWGAADDLWYTQIMGL